MNEFELRKIEIKINNIMKIREHFVNIFLLIISGSLGLILSEFNFWKLSLALIGILINFLFALHIIDCNNKITKYLRSF